MDDSLDRDKQTLYRSIPSDENEKDLSYLRTTTQTE